VNEWTDRDVEAHWDRVAEIYVTENTKVKDTHDQRFVKSIGRLELYPGCKVLNITSRDCECDDYIRRACPTAEVLNAEISAGLMREAARLRPHVKQQKLETYSHLPFEDKYFDRVISLETLEHCAEPAAFLSELYRVSTDDTVLVLSCPPATCELSYQLYTHLVGGHGEGPHRFPSSRDVKLMFEQTGWRLKHHEGTLLIPVGPRFLKRLGEKIIERCQNTFIAELGIRQLYVKKH